ncbi:MAG: hypothetical protein AAF612_04655 [Planctomycetota bacterium]
MRIKRWLALGLAGAFAVQVAESAGLGASSAEAQHESCSYVYPPGVAETPDVLAPMRTSPVIVMAAEPSAQAPRIHDALRASGINRPGIRVSAAKKLRALGVPVFDNHPDFREAVERAGVGYTVIVEYDVTPRYQGLNGPVVSTMTLSVRLGPLGIPTDRGLGVAIAEVYSTQRRTRVDNGGEVVSVFEALLEASVAEIGQGLRKAQNRRALGRNNGWRPAPADEAEDRARAERQRLRRERREALEAQAEAQRRVEEQRREIARAQGRGHRTGEGVELSAGPDATPQEVLWATMAALGRGDRAEAESYVLPDRRYGEVVSSVLDTLEGLHRVDAAARAAFGRAITTAHPYNSDHLRRALAGSLNQAYPIGDRIWGKASIDAADVTVLGNVARVRLGTYGDRLILMRKTGDGWRVDLPATMDHARRPRELQKTGVVFAAIAEGLNGVADEILSGELVTERAARTAFETRVNECITEATRGF